MLVCFGSCLFCTICFQNWRKKQGLQTLSWIGNDLLVLLIKSLNFRISSTLHILCIKLKIVLPVSHLNINFDNYMLVIIYSCNFSMAFCQVHFNFCPLHQVVLEDGKI